MIGVSVFYINYDRHPNLFNILRELSQAVTALKDVKDLKQIYKKMLRDIEYNQRQSENQINQKRKKKSQLKKKLKFTFLQNI